MSGEDFQGYLSAELQLKLAGGSVTACSGCMYWEELIEPRWSECSEKYADDLRKSIDSDDCMWVINVVHNGTCRRYPPVFRRKGEFVQPCTEYHHWCGEYKKSNGETNGILGSERDTT